MRKFQTLFKLMLAIILVFQTVASTALAQRRSNSLPLVRDAEIEALIRDYSQPLFKAAGLSSNSIEIFLLNNRQFNAFVTGTRMFINTGAIAQAGTPNEIIGVFAHETGHIIGGHLTRMRDRLDKAQLVSVLALLAGAGVAAAGSGSAGGALIMGSQHAIMRSLLSYQRDEEVAADRTGAELLEKTGQSGLGMLNTFRRLGKNPLFSNGTLDPYAISHPLPRERVSLLETVVSSSPHYGKKDSPSLQVRHDMARAKIIAYTGGPNAVRNAFRRNLNSVAGRYGHAIATFLSGSPRRALPHINRLIKEQPNNPYLHEMKGEMQLRAGNAAAAAKAFAKAVSLDRHQSGLLRIQLGHALLETNNAANLDKAIKQLKAGISRDRYSANAYGYLARAYAKQGNQILAIAASAEERFLQGNIKDAKQFARRAQPKVKSGSPQWLRLQDIIDYKPGKS